MPLPHWPDYRSGHQPLNDPDRKEPAVSDRLRQLQEKFRPHFEKIADGASERDATRALPYELIKQLIADGCSTPEVAAKLYISQKTVKNHLANIFQKLAVSDRTQAAIEAIRLGIAKPS